MTSLGDLVDDFISATTPEAEELALEKEDSPRFSVFDLLESGKLETLAAALRDGGISVNARDATTGRALLHEACVSGDLEAVKLLLQHPSIDIMGRTMMVIFGMGRCSALHLAVVYSHRAVVFMLLSHGADAQSRDRFGCSPMHYVKALNVAKLLVQYGAKVLDYNSKRKSALESVEMREEDPDDKAAEYVAARAGLLKYLRSQAELEFKAKLELLRQMKKKAKPSMHSKKKARQRITELSRATPTKKDINEKL